MKAADNGNVAICEAIILAGADLFLVDVRNRRADQHAVCNGFSNISELIVNYIN